MNKETVEKLKKAEKEGTESDLQATILHLRAQLQEKSALIQQFQKSRGGQIELARSISESVKALEPSPLKTFTPRNTTSSEVALVANLSDLHIGELIRPVETGGFGAFNFKIAQKRLNEVHLENLLNWTELNRRGYNIPDLHIFGIGDCVSGDIHQELLVTNEFRSRGR